jgi:hypothetical protein
MATSLPRKVALTRSVAVCVCVALALLAFCNRTIAQSATAVRKDYADVVERLRPFIQQQKAEKELPALSMAIIDDQQIVWAEGFGMADPKSKTPAIADTFIAWVQFPNEMAIWQKYPILNITFEKLAPASGSGEMSTAPEARTRLAVLGQ